MRSKLEESVDVITKRSVTTPIGAAIDPVLFRKTMGCFATGVAIVTTKKHDQLCGMTVNSLASVSMRPRLILVCLAIGARTTAGVQARGWFVVHILHRDQAALANRFARPCEDHFTSADFIVNEYDLPVLRGCLAHLVCRLKRSSAEGDHVAVIGEVCKAEFKEAAPLLFFSGAYRTVDTEVEHANFDWYW